MGLGGAQPASPPPSSGQAKPVGSDQSKPAGSAAPPSDTAPQQPGGIQWTNPWSGLCTGQDAKWDTTEYGPGPKKVTLQTCITAPETDGCDEFLVTVGDDNKIVEQKCPASGCPTSTAGSAACTPRELGDDNCKHLRTALVFNSCANKQLWNDNIEGPVGAIKTLVDDQSMRDMLIKANDAQAMTIKQMMMTDVPKTTSGYMVGLDVIGGANSGSNQLTTLIKSAASSSTAATPNKTDSKAPKPGKSGGLF